MLSGAQSPLQKNFDWGSEENEVYECSMSDLHFLDWTGCATLWFVQPSRNMSQDALLFRPIDHRIQHLAALPRSMYSSINLQFDWPPSNPEWQSKPMWPRLRTFHAILLDPCQTGFQHSNKRNMHLVQTYLVGAWELRNSWPMPWWTLHWITQRRSVVCLKTILVATPEKMGNQIPI